MHRVGNSHRDTSAESKDFTSASGCSRGTLRDASLVICCLNAGLPEFEFCCSADQHLSTAASATGCQQSFSLCCRRRLRWVHAWTVTCYTLGTDDRWLSASSARRTHPYLQRRQTAYQACISALQHRAACCWASCWDGQLRCWQVQVGASLGTGTLAGLAVWNPSKSGCKRVQPNSSQRASRLHDILTTAYKPPGSALLTAAPVCRTVCRQTPGQPSSSHGQNPCLCADWAPDGSKAFSGMPPYQVCRASVVAAHTRTLPQRPCLDL